MDRLQQLLDERYPLFEGISEEGRKIKMQWRQIYSDGYNARIAEEKTSGRVGEQTGQAFHIDVHGDPSVGLFGGIMKVTFEDNTVWDTEMTEAAKEVLSDFYDVSTKSVRTTEEQAAEDKALDKYIGDTL